MRVHLIINEELFEMEKQCERLIEKIITSKAMKEYELAKKTLAASLSAQKKIDIFKKAKEKFEVIEEYGEYAPDYHMFRQEVYQAKRILDLDEDVYQYRVAERLLQSQLDLIAKKLASSISENILVSAGDPFSLSVVGLPTACEIHLGKRKDIEL